jgi:guanine deaminase
LVNGHNHAQVTLAKGLFDRHTLEVYLNAMPWASGRHTLEDTYLSAKLGALEMVRKGCTAAYDMFGQFPLPTADAVAAVGSAYRDVGMRAVIAPMLADRSFYAAIPGLLDALPAPLAAAADAIRYAPDAASLAACRGILESWPFDREWIRPALGPTIPYHCSDAFLTACRDLARDCDVGMQMHVAESRVQFAVGRKRYGRSLIAHLDELGLLEPKFCASHAVWIDDDDRKRLADRGASVSHNPGSNLKLGSGCADLRRLLDAGVGVAIGTDGASARRAARAVRGPLLRRLDVAISGSKRWTEPQRQYHLRLRPSGWSASWVARAPRRRAAQAAGTRRKPTRTANPTPKARAFGSSGPPHVRR